MPPFHTIVTHPGGAHKDEFLACCVLLALRQAPIHRREPSAADLADPAICVVDVGCAHDPARNNFDHHQLPRDHPPTCSLSLVLQAIGLYADAREFCPWLEPAEWFDSRGPFNTAAWLGLDRDLLPKLASPIDATLLRHFSAATRLAPGEPLCEMMQVIGRDILDFVTALRARLAELEAHAEFWPLLYRGRSVEVVYLPRTEPLPAEPSLGLEQFIDRRGKRPQVAALVYPDRRGAGFALARFRDFAGLDFARIAGQPDVHFAHARGFVAKTSATAPDRLRELLQLAFVP